MKTYKVKFIDDKYHEDEKDIAAKNKSELLKLIDEDEEIEDLISIKAI